MIHLTTDHVAQARDELARRYLIDFTEQTLPGYSPAAHHRRIAEKLEAVHRGEIDRLMIFMPPRHGKALEISTPIPTPTGWSAIGDLRPGDEVFSDTGDICRVIAVSPVWKDRPCYRVMTDDGDSVIADAEHEWVVRLCRKRPVFKAKTTRWLAERDSNRAPMIHTQGALNTSGIDLPIHPWVLGLWLGDGCTHHATITAHDDDAKWLRAAFARKGYVTTDRATKQTFGVIGLQSQLRAAGLLGQKSIPHWYLRSSPWQRRALLQGLMDSDGYVAPDGQCEFCSTSRCLAEGVRELVNSLGYKASFIEGRACLEGRYIGPKWRVMFYMPNAASLPRKAERCREPRQRHRYLTFEEAGTADTVCIEVDSPSHMFLCGRTMIPTHNSELATRRWPAWCMGKDPRIQIASASYNSDLAMDFGRQVRNIVGGDDFARIFPGVGLSADSKAANRMNTNKGGTYVAVGVGQALTGRGADILLIDDPLKDRQEADSETVRNSVWSWYTSTAYTRLMPGGRVVVIMTRWNDDDLAGRLLNDAGGDKWDVLDLPAINEAGEALWPEWYDVPALERIKAAIGPREWSALYQQKPTPDEGTYFRKEWFDGRRFVSGELPTLQIYGTSDYATKDGSGDYTVHHVWGVDIGGDLFLVDRWRGQTTSDVWIERQCDLIERYKPLAWFGEAGAIYRAVEPALMRRMRERKCYVRQENLPSIADKPTSARGFQARAAMRKVWLPDTAEGEAVLDELLRFPAGKYDDEVDACSKIGRALDMAHPAVVVSKPIANTAPSDYRRPAPPSDASAWG